MRLAEGSRRNEARKEDNFTVHDRVGRARERSFRVERALLGGLMTSHVRIIHIRRRMEDAVGATAREVIGFFLNGSV